MNGRPDGGGKNEVSDGWTDALGVGGRRDVEVSGARNDVPRIRGWTDDFAGGRVSGLRPTEPHSTRDTPEFRVGQLALPFLGWRVGRASRGFGRQLRFACLL